MVARGRRVERHPARALEGDLDPQVRVLAGQRHLSRGRGLRVETHDDPGGDLARPQHEEHRDRVLVVIADELIGAQEILDARRAVARQRQLIGAVGVEALVVERALDGADLGDAGRGVPDHLVGRVGHVGGNTLVGGRRHW